MKKLSSVVMAMMFAVSVFAQDQERDQIQEHMMLKDGKMYRIQDQDQTELKDQVRLKDGTILNPDGTIRLKDQKKVRLRDGECIDMDGNRYASQQEFRQQMQSRAHAMAQEHLMLQNGQMFRIQNQQKIQIQEKLTLRNGVQVNPDGSLESKDGSRRRLRDGECLDMDGNRYASQLQFHQQMQSRFQAMAQEHLMVQNGQLYRIQNQQRTQVQEPLTLPNGMIISPDGSVQTPDKKHFRLRDGECLDMDGKRYETQERFREKMEQRNMERMNRGGVREKVSADKRGGKKG